MDTLLPHWGHGHHLPGGHDVLGGSVPVLALPGPGYVTEDLQDPTSFAPNRLNHFHIILRECQDVPARILNVNVNNPNNHKSFYTCRSST